MRILEASYIEKSNLMFDVRFHHLHSNQLVPFALRATCIVQALLLGSYCPVDCYVFDELKSIQKRL
jgi:hypothetical protein